MELPRGGVDDEEVGALREEEFVAGAGGGVEDVAVEVGGGVARAGEEDGEGEGEVGVAEEGVEGCLEEFVDALRIRRWWLVEKGDEV